MWGMKILFEALFRLNKFMTIETLINHAREAQTFSKSPYSNYAVGAALLTNNGDVIYGCNVNPKHTLPHYVPSGLLYFQLLLRVMINLLNWQ